MRDESDSNSSLDPEDWDALRADGHRMLDDMIDHLRDLRQQPVWQPLPAAARARFDEPLPHHPTQLRDVHALFMQDVVPFSGGNAHPGFMGWVQGGGTAVGMLAELLAGGLNANLGGRNHAPIEVEQQILRWMRELFRFPHSAEGIFVTGTSIAHFIGVLVAKTKALGIDTRRTGVVGLGERKLVAYTSAATHSSVRRAIDMAGLGSDALRVISVNEADQIDVAALRAAIASDRASGYNPFLIVAAAGTVNVGAIDDLDSLADVARDEGIWLHIDGAIGALGMLSPDIAPRLRGIERADSIAFDFHKWGQVPYDAGFILVRDGELQRDTFSSSAAYLTRDKRGLAAGEWWPTDYGPDLSRGFRALKTWFTLKVYGVDALGAMMWHTCELAEALGRKIEQEPELELLAPVQLNIVCFRYCSEDPDALNTRLVAELQESGIVAPSLTRVRGQVAIRAAIVNHRTQLRDIHALIDTTVALGRSALADAVAPSRSICGDRWTRP